MTAFLSPCGQTHRSHRLKNRMSQAARVPVTGRWVILVLTLDSLPSGWRHLRRLPHVHFAHSPAKQAPSVCDHDRSGAAKSDTASLECRAPRSPWELSCLWSPGALAGVSCHRPPGAQCRVREGGAGHRPTLWQGPEVCTLCRHLKNSEKLVLGRYRIPRATVAVGGRGAQGVREGCGLFLGGGEDVLGIFWWGQWVNPRRGEHTQGRPGGQGPGAGVGCTDWPSMTSVRKTIRKRRPVRHREQPYQSAHHPQELWFCGACFQRCAIKGFTD